MIVEKLERLKNNIEKLSHMHKKISIIYNILNLSLMSLIGLFMVSNTLVEILFSEYAVIIIPIFSLMTTVFTVIQQKLGLAIKKDEHNKLSKMCSKIYNNIDKNIFNYDNEEMAKIFYNSIIDDIYNEYISKRTDTVGIVEFFIYRHKNILISR